MRTRFLVFGACLVFSARVAADDLKTATRLFDEMEYKKAMAIAGKLLRASNSQPRDLAGAYYVQGLCFAALGKNGEAVRAFRSLLSIDPSFQPSTDLSPKLMVPFSQAIEISRRQKPIGLDHQPPDAGESIGDLTLNVVLVADPVGLVNAVRVRLQTDEGGPEQQLIGRVTRPGNVAIKLPAGLNAREIRYNLEAINKQGGVLARAKEPGGYVLRVRGKAGIAVSSVEGGGKPSAGESGTDGADSSTRVRIPLGLGNWDAGGPDNENLPPPDLVLEPEPEPEPAAVVERTQEEDRSTVTPWYRSWWFWTVVGVVAAGAATGTVLAVQNSASNGPVDYGIRIE